jgi:hypothetical protein
MAVCANTAPVILLDEVAAAHCGVVLNCGVLLQLTTLYIGCDHG